MQLKPVSHVTVPCPAVIFSRYFVPMTLDQSTCGCAGGDVKKLDFRFFAGNKKIGAPFHGLKAFFTTGQLNVLDKVVTPALLEHLLEVCMHFSWAAYTLWMFVNVL